VQDHPTANVVYQEVVYQEVVYQEGDSVDLLIHAFGMLCALASATFATRAAAQRWTVVAFVAAFVASATWTRFVDVPDPALIGILVALVAVVRLKGPRFSPVAAVSAGALAAIWVSVLQLQGMPVVPAVVMAIAVPTASMTLALRRSWFAPPQLHEEALLLVAGLGLAVTAGPAVASGWQSAALMNLQYEASGSGLPPWALIVSAASVALGGGYSLWWRTR
jgi:hypothetical protein